MRLLPLVSIAAASAALLAATPDAQACSCAQPASAEIAFEGAKFVFEGRAGAVTPETPTDGAVSGLQPTTVPFEVLRSWKGGLTGTASVHTARSSAACGRTYAAGESYLVYAGANEEGQPWDTICTRTRPSKGNAADVAVLDGLKPAGTKGENPADPAPADEAPADAAPADAAPADTTPADATPADGDTAGGETTETTETGAAETPNAVPEPEAPIPETKTAAGPDAADPSCALVAAHPAGWLALLPLIAVRRRR